MFTDKTVGIGQQSVATSSHFFVKKDRDTIILMTIYFSRTHFFKSAYISLVVKQRNNVKADNYLIPT